MSGRDNESVAIERLQMAAKLSEERYGKPLTVCYSGGKDSQVLVELALRSGIDFTAKHNLTTADAPETVRTVRETFRALEDRGIKAEISHPPVTMWELIPQKLIPPTRLMRYCCEVLKEQETAYDDFIATGVRRAESVKRGGRGVVDALAKRASDREHFDDEVLLSNDNGEKRRTFEQCMKKQAMSVNPIVDWTDAEVLRYYWSECSIHNPLYLRGFSRVGCIGCPMAGKRQRKRDFGTWPQYERAYKRAFDKMLEERKRRGLETRWKDGEAVFRWWIEDERDERQLVIDWGDDEG